MSYCRIEPIPFIVQKMKQAKSEKAEAAKGN